MTGRVYDSIFRASLTLCNVDFGLKLVQTSLVACSNIEFAAVDVHSLGNVGRLLFNGDQQIACREVETYWRKNAFRVNC
jgi:hypothetical protein